MNKRTPLPALSPPAATARQRGESEGERGPPGGWGGKTVHGEQALDAFNAKVAKYEAEKADIQKKAEDLVKEGDAAREAQGCRKRPHPPAVSISWRNRK